MPHVAELKDPVLPPAALFAGLYFAACFVLRPLTTRLLPRYSAILSSLPWAAVLAAILAVSDLPATVALYGILGFGVALLLRGLAAAAVFAVIGRSEWWHFKRLVVPAPGVVLAVVLALMLFARSRRSAPASTCL